jgi:hypothetical protein
MFYVTHDFYLNFSCDTCLVLWENEIKNKIKIDEVFSQDKALGHGPYQNWVHAQLAPHRPLFQ